MNLVNLINGSSQSTQIQATPNVNKGKNPFANPFMETTRQNTSFYGKNQPVFGGYFAGYLNGKPNIVGQKLFIEV